MVSINRLVCPLVRALFILALSIAPGLAQSATVAAAAEADSSVGATLTILAAPVDVATGGGAFSPAVDGQRLYAGDMVRTGPGGVAVLTYFDGSESQLGAESQVLIERAEATPAPQISFMQTAGVTVNHVVPLPQGGSFRTNTPSVAGLVRGTSYIVSVAADGSPVTSTGDAPANSSVTSVVLLTDRDGHVGRVDVARPGSPEPAVRLAVAGEAAAGSSTTAPTRAQLDPPSVARLEAAANARKDLAAAREAERHAHALEHAMAPVLESAQRPGDRQNDPATGKPATPVLVLPTASPSQTTQPPSTWAIAASDSPLLESRMIKQKGGALAEIANTPAASAPAAGSGSAGAPGAASGSAAAPAEAPGPASGSRSGADSASASRAAPAPTSVSTTASAQPVEQKPAVQRRPNRGGGSSSSPSPSTSSSSSPDASAPAASQPAASAPSASQPAASAPAPSQPAAANPPASTASAQTQPAPQASAAPAPATTQPPAAPPPASPAPQAAAPSAPPVAAPAPPPVAAPSPPQTSAAPTHDKEKDKDKGPPPPDHS